MAVCKGAFLQIFSLRRRYYEEVDLRRMGNSVKETLK